MAAARARAGLRPGGPGSDDPRRAQLRPRPRGRGRDPHPGAGVPRGPHQPADLTPPKRCPRRRPDRRPGRRPHHRARDTRRPAGRRLHLCPAVPPPGRRVPGCRVPGGAVTYALPDAAILLTGGLLTVGLILRRAFLVTTVDGSSMEPALRSGDRLLVRRTKRPRVGQVV